MSITEVHQYIYTYPYIHTYPHIYAYSHIYACLYIYTYPISSFLLAVVSSAAVRLLAVISSGSLFVVGVHIAAQRCRIFLPINKHQQIPKYDIRRNGSMQMFKRCKHCGLLKFSAQCPLNTIIHITTCIQNNTYTSVTIRVRLYFYTSICRLLFVHKSLH